MHCKSLIISYMSGAKSCYYFYWHILNVLFWFWVEFRATGEVITMKNSFASGRNCWHKYHSKAFCGILFPNLYKYFRSYTIYYKDIKVF